MHALETDAVYRMHLNTINNGSISNFPDDYCVEVRCTVDRTGIHQEQVGRLPLQLAGLCRGLADMQTLASEAVLEKDLRKALWACQLDPTTAACATPATIRQCFNEILAVEGPWLEEFWGTELSV
jgi:alpha-galactosidase